eukprot:5279195-Pleurochrysis_carterae.AAC.1
MTKTGRDEPGQTRELESKRAREGEGVRAIVYLREVVCEREREIECARGKESESQRAQERERLGERGAPTFHGG